MKSKNYQKKLLMLELDGWKGDEIDRTPIFGEGYMYPNYPKYFEIFISNTRNTGKGIFREVYTATDQSFLERQNSSPIIPFQIRLNRNRKDNDSPIIFYPGGMWMVYDYYNTNGICDYEYAMGRFIIYYDEVINAYVVKVSRTCQKKDTHKIFKLHDYLRRYGKEYTTIIFTYYPKNFIRSENPTIITNLEDGNMRKKEKLNSAKLDKKWKLILTDPNPGPVFSEEYRKNCETIRNWIGGNHLIGSFWFFDKCSDTVIHVPYFSSDDGSIIYDKEKLIDDIVKSTTLYSIEPTYGDGVMIDRIRAYYDFERRAIVLTVNCPTIKQELLKIIGNIIKFSVNPINILIIDNLSIDVYCKKSMEIDISKIKRGFNDGSDMRKYKLTERIYVG